jgi:hypothetical protein
MIDHREMRCNHRRRRRTRESSCWGIGVTRDSRLYLSAFMRRRMLRPGRTQRIRGEGIQGLNSSPPNAADAILCAPRAIRKGTGPAVIVKCRRFRRVGSLCEPVRHFVELPWGRRKRMLEAMRCGSLSLRRVVRIALGWSTRKRTAKASGLTLAATRRRGGQRPGLAISHRPPAPPARDRAGWWAGAVVAARAP